MKKSPKKAGENVSAWRNHSLRALVAVGTASVVVALGLWAIQGAWRYVASLEEFRVCPGDLQFGQVPWVDGAALRSELRLGDRAGVLSSTYSIFDPGLSSRVAEVLRDSPWVLNVGRVTKRFPNRLEVELEMRKPVAVVRANDADIMVDKEIVPLPKRLFVLPVERRDQPRIKLVYKVERPRFGRSWADDGVVGGVRMLAFLRRHRVLEQVRLSEVEVSRKGLPFLKHDIQLELVTSTGARIKWGAPPSDVEPLRGSEVATPAKLKALLAAIREAGPSLEGIKYVDVRCDDPVWVRLRAG